MERLTDVCWRNFDPWECCGQDHYCQRGCHDEGGCTNGCIVPKLYARLAAYEDTGLTPEEIKEVQEAMAPIPFGRFHDIMEAERAGRLVLPLEPTTPLTLEELREMDGEPVWVVGFLKESFWGLVHVWGDSDKLECIRADHLSKDGRWYGKTDILPGWLAYRRKPEERTVWQQ